MALPKSTAAGPAAIGGVIVRAGGSLYGAVLFDMDGVIVDTAASVVRFWRSLAAHHGLSLSDGDLDSHVFGRRASHTLDALFPDLDEARREEVYSRLERYESALSYREVPGASGFVAELDRFGVPCALVTGANPWKAEAVVSQLGLRNTFAALVVADDVVKGKPDPEGYRLAARRLGVPTDRCVVFEDAESGACAAAAAGTLCVGVGSSESELALVNAGASFMVPDFRSVGVREVDRKLYGGVGAYLKVGAGVRTVALPLLVRRRTAAKRH